MPLGHFLLHRVQVLGRAAVLDAGDPTYDDYGQPVTEDATVYADVPAAIQPRSAQELASFSQGGVATSTHRIFCYPMELSTADLIYHDPALCPMTPDLPDARYEITGTPQGAGAGRHLELDVRLVQAAQEAESTEAPS